jgi:hemerythrin
MDLGSRGMFGRLSGLHGLTDFSLRQLIAWGDHLKVDQAQIDAQHEAIFNLATHIVDLWQKHADVGQVKAAAEKLAKVLDAHFRYEERELARIGYPKLAEHRAEHKVMLDELRLIRDRLDGMGQGTVQGEPGFLVLNFVLGVTIGHIFHSDMQYCVFARHASGNDADEEEGLGWPVS